MRMRKKPVRGEKLQLLDGTAVTALDVVERDYVKVILPTGRIEAVHKNVLQLPVIDTKAYEKYPDDAA